MSTSELQHFESLLKEVHHSLLKENVEEAEKRLTYLLTTEVIPEIHDVDVRMHLYMRMFVIALQDKHANQQDGDAGLSDGEIVSEVEVESSPYRYGPTKTMLFLVKKLRADGEVMSKVWPSMVEYYPRYQAMGSNSATRATTLILRCMDMYETDMIRRIHQYLVKGGDKVESKNLLKMLFEHMKEGDVNNRCRVYNRGLCFNDTVSYQFFAQHFWVDNELIDHRDELTLGWCEEHGFTELSRCIEATTNGALALHDAASKGKVDVIAKLFKACPDPKRLDVNFEYRGRTALHEAVIQRRNNIITYLLTRNELNVNARFNACSSLEKRGSDMSQDGMGDECPVSAMKDGWTALHLAVHMGNTSAVKILCSEHKHLARMRSHLEDASGKTPLDIVHEKLKQGKSEGFPFANELDYRSTVKPFASDLDYKYIEKILLGLPDVEKAVDLLYRDRQLYVDAANAILVGSALIASVTFAGWLSPPTGYSPDYETTQPLPLPPNIYESYILIQGHTSIQAFMIFNSLSFFFAIATIIAGADVVFPVEEQYIRDSVEIVRGIVKLATRLLVLSVVCVLGAFTSAGIAIVPPVLKYKNSIIVSTIVGGGVCIITLFQLMNRHFTSFCYLKDWLATHLGINTAITWICEKTVVIKKKNL